MSVARRSLQIVAFIATLIVGVASMAVIVTQTTWFKEWLRGFIVRQAEDPSREDGGRLEHHPVDQGAHAGSRRAEAAPHAGDWRDRHHRRRALLRPGRATGRHGRRGYGCPG